MQSAIEVVLEEAGRAIVQNRVVRQLFERTDWGRPLIDPDLPTVFEDLSGKVVISSVLEKIGCGQRV